MYICCLVNWQLILHINKRDDLILKRQSVFFNHDFLNIMKLGAKHHRGGQRWHRMLFSFDVDLVLTTSLLKNSEVSKNTIPFLYSLSDVWLLNTLIFFLFLSFFLFLQCTRPFTVVGFYPQTVRPSQRWKPFLLIIRPPSVPENCFWHAYLEIMFCFFFLILQYVSPTHTIQQCSQQPEFILILHTLP